MAHRTTVAILGAGLLIFAGLLVFFARSGDPQPLDAPPGPRAAPTRAGVDAQAARPVLAPPAPASRTSVAPVGAQAPRAPAEPSVNVGAGSPPAAAIHPARAKGAAALATAPAVDAAPPADVRASLDKGDIQSVIASLKPRMADCYAQALTRDPSLHGQVTVEFTLKRDVVMGSVPADGSIAGSTLNAPLVEACMLEKLRDAKFPEMTGEGTVKVRYPFRFANPSPDAG